MRRISLLAILAPALLSADLYTRFARVTVAEGAVEVERANGQRAAAEPNLPVGQGFWIETGAAGRGEIAFDDGSRVRLGPGSLAELSDLTRLSTGQRITLVWLERGTLYATAEASGLDAFLLVAPGVELTIGRRARVRVEAGDETTVAVLEGRVRFSSRVAELDLNEGHMVRVDPESHERFQLFREVTAAESDAWSDALEREAARRTGLAELDAHGKWIEAPKLGRVWQPRVAAGWKPFRFGRWRWYEATGYTWIAAEPWGWLPYHWGRWTETADGGWAWAPGDLKAPFHPGETYWTRGAKAAGWGPLEPGEEWSAQGAPRLAAAATYALYEAGARLLEAGTAREAGPVQFVVALPPPPALAAVFRPKRKMRLATAKILPLNPETAYQPAETSATGGIRIVGTEPPPVIAPAPPASPEPTYYYYPPPPPPAAVFAPPPPPELVYYPVYVPSVVLIDRDSGHGDRGGRRHDAGARPQPPAQSPAPPPARAKSSPPAPPPPATPPQPAAAPAEGPEHRTRLRSPESNSESTGRRR